MSQARVTSNYPNSSLTNKIINGCMRVTQRGVGPTSGSNYTTLDRWKFYQNGSTGAYNTAQVADAPAGFSHSLKLTVTASQASLGSTDYFSVNQIIEGVNTSDLNWGSANAQPVTVSFWVKSSVTGTFSSGVQSCDGTFAVYQTTVSIPVANTWTKISYTIPGAVIGSWAGGTTSPSIFFYIGLGNGSTYSTSTINSWVTGNYFGYTGQTSLVATSGATFYITGVDLRRGSYSTAPTFDMRQYGQELALCQRYYQTSYLSQTAGFHFGATGYTGTNLLCSMRTTPTVAVTSGGSWVEAGLAYTITSITGTGASTNSIYTSATITGGTSGYAGCSYSSYQASAEL
jgi:hypothetical protein